MRTGGNVMHIIDRRLNPGGKSLVNRQRFLRRAKAAVQQAVRESLKDRSIRELEQEGKITIARGGIHEPTLRRSAQGGNREYVLPGNSKYLEGDKLPRPTGSSGRGSQAGTGDSEDDFQFVLSREEFLDLFLDDLELPDLAKRRLVGHAVEHVKHAGYTTAGSPGNLSFSRTLRKAKSRHRALHRPGLAELKRLEDEIAEIQARQHLLPHHIQRLEQLRQELTQLLRRRALVPYIDPLDLRYRRYEPVNRAVAQAVMFCLMDVSGSMDEHMKDLAKRFFALLHLFLSRSYKYVDVVFIQHTDRAAEVDEQTFFYGTVSGGTLVSSAFEKLLEIIASRYRLADWNIYVAQASDGDNMPSDNPLTARLMQEEILPIAQYVAYLEVGQKYGDEAVAMVRPGSNLWTTYKTVAEQDRHFAMRRVYHRREIYPVFRELFQRGGPDEQARN